MIHDCAGLDAKRLKHKAVRALLGCSHLEVVILRSGVRVDPEDAVQVPMQASPPHCNFTDTSPRMCLLQRCLLAHTVSVLTVHLSQITHKFLIFRRPAPLDVPAQRQ